MRNEIIKSIKYFNYFAYPPSFEEIYTFLPVKTTKNKLEKVLETLIDEKIIKYDKKLFLYTLGEYSSFFRNKVVRAAISQKKLNKIKLFTKILSIFSQIKFIGLSGSMAMMNSSMDDDIDLFIISASDRLWTARFIANILAMILGLKRRRGVNQAKDKVCLNLFFDEKRLTVPEFKKTEYVAHEVLQVKPLVDKDFIYERFLKANNWVYKIYPNANKTNFKFQISNFKLNIVFNFLFSRIELLLKDFQLTLINKHKTNEIITDLQLWFFPEDFEEKLPTIE